MAVLGSVQMRMHPGVSQRVYYDVYYDAQVGADKPIESTVRHEPNREAMVADARRDPADVTRDRSYGKCKKNVRTTEI